MNTNTMNDPFFAVPQAAADDRIDLIPQSPNSPHHQNVNVSSGSVFVQQSPDRERGASEDFSNSPDTILGRSNEGFDDTETRDVFRHDTDLSDKGGEIEERPKTTLINTFVNFMKAGIGTGILAMPDAVKNGGLAVGSAGIIFLGFLTTYCCHELLHAYVQVSNNRPMSYSQVTYLAFRRVGPRMRRLAKPSIYIIDTFLVLTQLGNCCVYILAVARMIREVVEYAAPSLGWDIRIYESLLLIVLIPSCFVTTLRLLSYFALFANVVQIAGLIVILQYVFQNLQVVENLSYIPPSFSTAPLFFGTAMFAFNVIPFLLPMETCMKNRAAFHRWDGLLSFGMTCVVVAHVAVGFYGYMAFGSDAKMILTNLPTNEWLYNIVKLMMAVAIFLSYNLQLYVPVEILYPPLKRRVGKPWFDRFGEYIFRTALVLLTFGLAVSIPCLELMISLFGALTAGSLNLVFPPIIELVCCFHPNGKTSVLTYIKCTFIILFGAFGCIVGSVVAVQAMVTALGSPQGCGN